MRNRRSAGIVRPIDGFIPMKLVPSSFPNEPVLIAQFISVVTDTIVCVHRPFVETANTPRVLCRFNPEDVEGILTLVILVVIAQIPHSLLAISLNGLMTHWLIAA